MVWTLGTRMSRRGALRSSAGCMLPFAAGLLSSCGPRRSAPPAAASAAPAPQHTGTEILFQANNQGVNWDKTILGLDQEFVDQEFNAKNPGLHATVFPGGWGNAPGQIAASIAGRGYVDIFHVCCGDLALLEGSGFLAPLDDYLRRDNIDASVWSKRRIDGLSLNGKVLALPSYSTSYPFSYRQDILDQLGYPYPSPDWTYEEALDLWTKVSGPAKNGGASSAWRYGAGIHWFNPYESLSWWSRAWGGEEMNAAHDQCLADSPECIQAYTAMHDLVKNKVARNGFNEIDSIRRGEVVFQETGGYLLFQMATVWGTKFKWDVLPPPRYPAGRSTMVNIDNYGLNAAAQNADAAWTLMKWLTFEPDWQRYQMRTTLVEPCLNSLWQEWETVVKAVAPPLQGKSLHWFADGLINDYAWPTLTFAHEADACNNIINDWINQMLADKVSAPVALQQLTRQINALEPLAAAESAKRVKMEAAFPTSGPAIAYVPAGV